MSRENFISENKDVIIKSKLLSQFPELIHGISTKLGGCESPPYYNNLSFFVGDDKNTVEKNREIFFHSLGIDLMNLAIPKQIHSSNIRIINNPGLYPETDALITGAKNLFLIISIADCFPVLIFDCLNKVVAAVHSGWRGTQKRILYQTLCKMRDEPGSKPEDMYVFLGPGICKEHFEVGDEVSKIFAPKYAEQKGNNYFVDLKKNLIDQLKDFNIPSQNIDIYKYCSFEEKDYLHSYRRDKDKSGRMVAVIGMR